VQGGFFFHLNEQRSLAEDPVEGKTTQTPGFLKEQKLIKRKIDTPRGLGGGRPVWLNRLRKKAGFQVK
jgi:hypothetical protein